MSSVCSSGSHIGIQGLEALQGGSERHSFFCYFFIRFSEKKKNTVKDCVHAVESREGLFTALNVLLILKDL